MKSIAVYLTGACNLRCKHCSVGLDQYRPRETLDDAQIMHVIEKAADRGVEYVTLLGGEPTYTRHDLAAFTRRASEVGVKLSINTNLFFPEKLLPLIDDPGLGNIVVSLDGAGPETHDAMRGKGSFARTIRNLELIIAARDRIRPELTIDLTFVLTALNQTDAIRIVDLAIAHRIDKLNINLINPVGRGNTFSKKLRGGDDYLAAISKMVLYFQLLRPPITLSIPLPPAVAEYLEMEYGVPVDAFINDAACGGTEVYTYVDLRGNLLPCPGLSYEEGRNDTMNHRHENLSILDRSIADIETTSVFRAFNKAQQSRSKNAVFEPCNVCKHRAVCSPCTASYYKKDSANVIDMCKRIYEKLPDDPRISTIFHMSESAEV
ncbi:radical SAM protein [Pseudooceanicola sediminis]|nr:radical SAM protein [Pseudooceanicola sediminis]|tara:strand:+ start:8136 stop:9266 length:1131 start_codon:yes stop_codon:yes gene_type:complete